MAANINDLLYYLEHRFLPQSFFDQKHDLIGSLRENPRLLYDVFHDLCDSEALECPFTPEQFRVTLRQNGQWTGALLVFPIPEAAPLCFEEYLFEDGDPAHRGCYTLEYTEDAVTETGALADPGADVCGTLCSWNTQRQHVNYGSRILSADSDYFAEAFALHCAPHPE